MPSKPHRARLTFAIMFLASMGAAFGAGALVFSGEESDPVVGTFTAIDRADSFLVAAPHGEYDAHTGEMARSLCEKTGWSCLIARGFEAEGTRINVNRPTEGVRRAETSFTPRAAQVYDAYLTKVQSVAPHLQLYVELHGNGHPDSQGLIEIATVGISEPWAHAIRNTLRRALHDKGLTHLEPRIDVLDDIRYGATHNREFGVLSMIEPALHIELPENARAEHRAQVVAALAEALPVIADARDSAQQFALR